MGSLLFADRFQSINIFFLKLRPSGFLDFLVSDNDQVKRLIKQALVSPEQSSHPSLHFIPYYSIPDFPARDNGYSGKL